MAIDTEEKRASAATAGTWLTRVLRPTGSVSTADRVFIVREYTGLTYGEPGADPIVDAGTYARVGASESTYNRTAASDTTYNRVAASETTYQRT